MLFETNDRLKSLAFDLFQRYRLLSSAGLFFARPGSRLRLLDVGGKTPVLWEGFRSLAREMVPDSFSVVADIAPGDGLTDYVRADALRLPFADESFDLVSAFDLLEHMPHGDRVPALQEMLRVTRDGLLVAFPFDSPVNRTAEKMLADFLALHFHGSIPMLDEHRTFGLPDRAQIERFFAGTGYPAASFDCGNTDVWLLLMMTQHALHRSGCDALVEGLNQRFNHGPVDEDWAAPSYRAYFLLSKRNTAAALDAFRSMPRDSRPSLAADSMLPVCRLLLDIAIRGKELAAGGRSAAPSTAVVPASDSELRAELDELRRYVKTALIDFERSRYFAETVAARIENLSRRLDEHGRQVGEAFRQITSILQSRIWRTLCALGGLVLRLTNGQPADSRTTLDCEEPAAAGASRNSASLEAGRGFASDYERWIAECEPRLPEPGTLELQPLVSVILPLSGAPAAAVSRAVRSVRAQSYANWELCISAADPQPPEIDRILSERTGEDARIRIARVPPGTGPSETANAALEMAGGEYIALLEDTAELAPGALLRLVGALNAHPGADVLYSDEDSIDEWGRRSEPYFKPDWSPDLLLSQNYIGGLLVARAALVRSEGGFRKDYDGAEDYDLVLRLTRRAGRIVHVPAVLYHRSARRVSNAAAARRAIEDHLRAEAVRATVEPGTAPGTWRVRYAIPRGARVSILIPAGGKLDALRANLESLFGKTDYPDYEVVIIDNSRGNAVRRYAETWIRSGRRLRWLDMRSWPFNYSALNNEAARRCDAPYLVFLNDDTEVIAPGWLTALMELGTRPEVGAVGAKLLYPSGRIQHAGVVVGLYECCAHGFRNLDGSQRHYFDLPDVIRNVSAVTGACLLVPASVFHEVGGFDEALFPVAFNDIDLCLRIGAKGYRVLYTPHALLYHRESYSKTLRDMDSHPGELLAMRDNWKHIIAADPFYSPHLTRAAEDYSLRFKY